MRCLGSLLAMKSNLIEKMNKARSMERLVVIPFENDQTTLAQVCCRRTGEIVHYPGNAR